MLIWRLSPPAFAALCATAVLLIVAALFLFPVSLSRKLATNYRLAFIAFGLLFVTLNVANWCNPGWCGSFGFPFRYRWWSDAIIIMNGKNLTAGSSVPAALADAGIGLAACALLVVAFRRSLRR